MNWPLFMTGMTETWREGRKLVDHSLRPGAVMIYGQMMQEKTREFLAQLFATPKNFPDHVKLSAGRFSASIVCLLTAGQPSGKIYHVTHIWLRPEGWRQNVGCTRSDQRITVAVAFTWSDPS